MDGACALPRPWPRPGAGDRAHGRNAPTMVATVIVGDYGDGSIQKNGGIGREPHSGSNGVDKKLGDVVGVAGDGPE